MTSTWDKAAPYLLLLPALALSLLAVAYPLAIDFVYSVQSFTSYFLPSHGFVGLGNFLTVFEDPIFQISLRNSLILAAGSAALQSVIGLGAASLLNYKFRGNLIAKIAVLFPWILPQTVAVLVWQALLNPINGVINGVFFQLHWINSAIAFLGNPIIVWPTVIGINVWETYPFYAITLLAAMTTVPLSLKEAAVIDGAGMWARFRHVTLPHVWPILTIVNLFSIVWSINGLTLIYNLTNGTGAPGLETMVLSVYTYNMMFTYNELSRAAAQALVMIGLQSALLYVLIKRTSAGFRRGEDS